MNMTKKKKNEPSRDAWQMWNIVFVQVMCIKDKITTGTTYSIMKKLNMTNSLEKLMTIYWINNYFHLIHKETEMWGMLFLSNAEQIFRASTFCSLIMMLIKFPDADGLFKSFLNQSRSKIERACPNSLFLKFSLNFHELICGV